jgi:F-type H+-transporting ATPase subunit epsilon
MHLEIITPDKKLFSGEVKSVSLPGADGSLGILKGHAPLITTLKSGTIKVVEENAAVQTFTVKGGVAEVLDNNVTILAD